MNEKLIKEFIQQLSSEAFTNAQLALINNTLAFTLKNYSIKQISNSLENNNEFLIEKFLLTKKIEGCSVKTLRYYSLMLNVFNRELSLDFKSATADDIRLFLNSYQVKRNTTNATLDNIRRVLSSFYNWLEEDDYIVKNPMKKIHKIKVSTLVKDIFSDEEIEELRNVTIHRIRDCAMQELLLSSGIRVGELVSLNRDSIDLNELSCLYEVKAIRKELYILI